MSEKEILEKYSTPGLKRNELSRQAKKEQLQSFKLTFDEIKEILDKLYGIEIEIIEPC